VEETMKALFLAIAIGCLTVSLLPAQVGVITPTPIAQPVYAQLKAFLDLTDAQVQSLVQIQSNHSAAQQAIYKQINDKQTQLNQSAPPSTSDALTAGQLEIDINNLRKQLQLPNSSYRASALAILTPDQTAKLADLVRALQLQQPAWQAITLDLIDPPTPSAPSPVPIPPMAMPVETRP
jgi:hypothetical protein